MLAHISRSPGDIRMDESEETTLPIAAVYQFRVTVRGSDKLPTIETISQAIKTVVEDVVDDEWQGKVDDPLPHVRVTGERVDA